MNKTIIKTLCISFIMLFSVFFINIMGVKAADECIYEGLYTGFNVSANGKIMTCAGEGCYKYGYQIKFKSDGSYECKYAQVEYSAQLPSSFKLSCTFSNSSESAIKSTYFSSSGCPSKIYLQMLQGGHNNVFMPSTTKTSDRYFALTSQTEASNNTEESQTKAPTTDPGKNNISNISDILNWAKVSESKSKSKKAEYDDCDIIGNDMMNFIDSLFLIIQVIGIILMVFLTAVEFIKVITGSEEDGLKSAFKNTIRRIIVVIILLLLPMLITWILNIVNDNNYKVDEFGDVVIGSNGKPLCK